MLEPGEQLERYRVRAVLGEGGVAVVYQVVHEQLGSVHALKVLQVASEQTRRRLLREGRAQAAVVHPNLVAVSDVIEIAGRPALVMEYIDGPTLETWLDAHRPSRSEALRMFRGVVLGAKALHEAGFVHRDLKPANVLLARGTGDQWRPKLTDFGLVKEIARTDPGDLSDHGLGLGTPPYMAPEQFQEKPDLDERADLFALGCILYELVTGHRAFQGDDLVEVAAAVCAGRYVPPRERVPDLPLAVVVAIDRLLQPDRTRRLRSCADLLELLYGGHGSEAAPSLPTLSPDDDPTGATVLDGSETPVVHTLRAARPRTSTPTGERRRRGLALWAIGGVAAMVALSAGLGFLVGRLDDRTAEPAVVPPTPGIEQADPLRPAPEPAVVAEPPAAAPEPAPAPAQAVAPSEEPPPPAPPPSATVQVEGDAEVELVGEAGTFVPGEVPPGAYEVHARFGDAEPVVAARLELEDGDAATVRCSSFAMRCNVTR